MNRLNRMIVSERESFRDSGDHMHLREMVLLETLALAIRCGQDKMYSETKGCHECWNGGDRNIKPDRYTYHDALYQEYLESECPGTLGFFIGTGWGRSR